MVSCDEALGDGFCLAYLLYLFPFVKKILDFLQVMRSGQIADGFTTIFAGELVWTFQNSSMPRLVVRV
nr:hypothetical protein CFP56_32715 [Quercus suber]